MATYKVTTTFEWVQYVDDKHADGTPVTEDEAISIAQGRYTSFEDLNETNYPEVEILESV